MNNPYSSADAPVKKKKHITYHNYILACFIFGGVSVVLCSIAIFIMLSSHPARGNHLCDTTERVFDNGNYLTDEEEKALASEVEKLSEKCRTDLIVYTDSDDLYD